MDVFDQNNYCSSIKELFESWKRKESSGKVDHQNSVFIPDGIVDPSEWGKNGNKKILFILKEAYGDDWRDNTLATWLHTYPKRRLWDRIARVVYGIQNTTATKIQRYKPVLSDDEFRRSLDQIAVLNLKKSNGKSQSDYEEIAEYAAFDREEIKKEIELIDADIIICGYTFTILLEKVFQKVIPLDEKCDNWYYHIDLFGKERLFIDYYHPAVHDADLLFYYGVVGIYQQSLIKPHIIPIILSPDCNRKWRDVDDKIFEFAYNMAFRDATMRNAFKKDGLEENLSEVKMQLAACFMPIVREYIDSIFAGEHPLAMTYITRLSSVQNTEFNVKRFTFGNAQKLVNMTAKYMFLSCYHNKEMRGLFDKCDCPMDSYMIMKVASNPERNYTQGLSWSRILDSDNDAYVYFQEQIKEKCGEKYLPIEYDFLHWDE